MATELELLDTMQGLVDSLMQGPGAVIPRTANLEACLSALGCYRTIAQRTLNNPARLLATAAVADGDDIWAPVVTGATGLLRNQPLLTFFDTSILQLKATVEQLVCVALRVRVHAWSQGGEAAALVPTPANGRDLADIIKRTMAIRAFDRAAADDPWIDTTTLGYFCRPGGEFVVVPPLYMVGIDPRWDVRVRFLDFASAVAASTLAGAQTPLDRVPTLIQDGAATTNAAAVIVESLMIPDPNTCGPFWPGNQCGAGERVANWGDVAQMRGAHTGPVDRTLMTRASKAIAAAFGGGDNRGAGPSVVL